MGRISTQSFGSQKVRTLKEASHTAKKPETIENEIIPSLNEKPDILPGRNVIVEKQVNGVLLRYEEVPCNSTRCKKKPDLHGPYWYSYEYIDGKFVVKYHGVKEPNLAPEFSYPKALSIIKKIGKQSTLDEDDLFILQKILSTFSENDSLEAAEIKENAIFLMNQEEKRRKKILHELHDRLLSKAESGKRLTKDERKTLRKTTALLADEH